MFKKNEIKWYTTPLPGQVNVCNIITVSHPKERPRHVGVQHTRWMSKRINLLSLSRLGHNLSIRKYLACFVVASSTRNVLPWLIRHITIRVIERNDVPNRRQKLKLRPLCSFNTNLSVIFTVQYFGFSVRTLRFGPAQLDGAHKCRKWHFIDIPVLRRAQRHRHRRWSSWELRPVPVVSSRSGLPYLRPDYFLGIAYGGG